MGGRIGGGGGGHEGARMHVFGVDGTFVHMWVYVWACSSKQHCHVERTHIYVYTVPHFHEDRDRTCYFADYPYIPHPTCSQPLNALQGGL